MRGGRGCGTDEPDDRPQRVGGRYLIEGLFDLDLVG